MDENKNIILTRENETSKEEQIIQDNKRNTKPNIIEKDETITLSKEDAEKEEIKKKSRTRLFFLFLFLSLVVIALIIVDLVRFFISR